MCDEWYKNFKRFAITRGTVLCVDTNKQNLLKYCRGESNAKASRTMSSSGIYHIMLRGINQQQIFEDEQDYKRFLKILEECKVICEYKIYAYK